MQDTIIEALFLSFFFIGTFFAVLFTVWLIAMDWR